MAGLGNKITTDLGEVGTEAGLVLKGSAAQSLPFQIGLLVRGIMGVLGVIFLILVVYAGYKWLLAAGDPNQVKEAHKLLLNSVIGLILTTAAFIITNFVIQAVQGAAL